MSKMRTIEQAYTYLMKKDSETALSKTALRRLVTNGDIPTVKIGSKYLINLETLESYLSTGNSTLAAIDNPSQIKKVDVKGDMYAK